MEHITIEHLKLAQEKAKECMEDYKLIQANLEFYIIKAWASDEELMESDIETL